MRISKKVMAQLRNKKKVHTPEELEEEVIEETFNNIIREQMTDKQFWAWANSWLDAEEICDQAEEWDLEDKNELIKDWQAGKIK